MKAIFRCCIGFWAIVGACGIAAAASAASPWEELAAFETHRAVEKNAAPFKPTPKKTSWGGWYAGMHTALMIVPDMDFVGSGLEMGVEFDPGFAVGGTFGYAYDFGLRVDAELTYRAVQATQLEISGFTFSGSGNVDVASFMLNGWFDVVFLSALLGDWVPYFGAGAGIANAWSNVGTIGVPLVDAEASAFVWQAGAGMAYKVTDRLFFTTDYRFFRTFGSFRFDDPFYADTIKAKFKAHNITIGFRGLF